MAYIQVKDRQEDTIRPEMLFFALQEEHARNTELLDVWNDQFDLNDRIAFRCDQLLVDCVDAVAEEYDLGRGEVVRKLIRIGIAQLEGEILENTDQLQLATGGSARGEGAGSPFGSSKRRGETSPRIAAAVSNLLHAATHPHAKQNPEAA